VNDERRLLAEQIFERSRAYDTRQEDRRRRYRNVEPESARLLHMLVLATHPRRVLELGTSNGYSTIWLGDACEKVGASLVTVDRDATRLSEAAAHLRAASLNVELREEDAGAVLRDSSDGVWDFVFLDAERDAYAGYWPDLLRTLAPGGLLAIDNVRSHAEEVAEVSDVITAERSVVSEVVPVGAGLRLVVKQ
jgi:predicted O-methyltransferase YrrM